MSPALASYAGASAGLIVFAGTTLVVLRLPGRLSPVGRQALLALLIHVATTALLNRLVPETTYWHGAALYWFGFNCFLYGFSAVYKSVSLRMLSKLAQAPNQCLAMSDIVDGQISSCFTDRVALLVNSGLAQNQDGKYTPLPQGLKVAGRIGLLQSIYGVVQSGLYTATLIEECSAGATQTAENSQAAAVDR
jgi:hypothetical protein